MNDEISIPSGGPESRAMVERVRAALARCEQLNQIPYIEADAVRSAWSELTGQAVDESFSLVPPFRTDHGVNIRVGHRVFVNHGCTFNDIGGIDIGDDVLIGPNVSLLSSGHRVEPDERFSRVTAARIVIERNVWIGAGATILQGVTIGADSVVAAGAVVSRDVPSRTRCGDADGGLRRQPLVVAGEVGCCWGGGVGVHGGHSTPK